MGHRAHGPVAKVPDPSKFQVGAHTPDLIKLQERLAMHGLKDPWIRNEVWKFDISTHGGPWKRFGTLMTRGMKTGAILFAATVGIEYVLDPYKKHH